MSAVTSSVMDNDNGCTLPALPATSTSSPLINLRDLALPDGQNTQAAGQPPATKIFAFTEFLFCRILRAPHPLSEGRIAIVTNVG
nr:hypothetical protein [Bradyrhizobium nitroreducens]